MVFQRKKNILVCTSWRVSSKASFSISILHLRRIPTNRLNTPPPALCLPSATEMWVNEAPPGGTVSNTYTTSLIRGRGGQGVGGGAREAPSTGNIKRWKCGRVPLIRQNDCGMCVDYRSLWRYEELYSREVLLQLLSARLRRNLKTVILGYICKNKKCTLFL